MSSRTTAQDGCPDFSTQFWQGERYIVFLKTAGKSLELLHEDWTTALRAEDGQVKVNMRGEEASADALVRKYAADRQRIVQEPDQNAPVWGTARGYSMSVLAVALLVAIAGGGNVFYRLKRYR